MSRHLLVIGSGPIGRGVLPLYFSACFDKYRIWGRDVGRTQALDQYLTGSTGLPGEKPTAKYGPGFDVVSHGVDGVEKRVHFQKVRAHVAPDAAPSLEGESAAYKAARKASAIAVALDPTDFKCSGAASLARALYHRFKFTQKNGSDPHVDVIIGMNVVGSLDSVVKPALIEQLNALYGEAEQRGIIENVVFHETAINQIACRDCKAGSYDILTEGVSDTGVILQEALRGSVPSSGSMVSARIVSFEDFKRWDRLKIWGSNCLHAVVAYGGYQAAMARGVAFDVATAYVHDVLRDPAAQSFVRRLVDEMSPSLAVGTGVDEGSVRQYLHQALDRFSNPFLRDPIGRVARDPDRKISLQDRLVGPALLMLEQGQEPFMLAQAIGWALQYPYKTEAGDVRSVASLEFARIKEETGSVEAAVRGVLGSVVGSSRHGEQLLTHVIKAISAPVFVSYTEHSRASELAEAVGMDRVSHLDERTRVTIQWSLANPSLPGAWDFETVLRISGLMSESEAADPAFLAMAQESYRRLYGDLAPMKARPDNVGRVFLRNYASVDEIFALRARVLDETGLRIDLHTGKMFYTPESGKHQFTARTVAYRHGQTFTNVEPRGYQGNVDEAKNQLTEIGISQAQTGSASIQRLLSEAAPTAIYSSPLRRARRTVKPYAKLVGVPVKMEWGIREMSFGDVDNRHLWDVSKNTGDKPDVHLVYGTPFLATDNPCHLFYLEQNVLWKASGGGESFAENVLRAAAWVEKQNSIHTSPEETVLLSSHSMFLAAVTAVIGMAKTLSDGSIGFDGHSIITHATPFVLRRPL